MAMLAGSVRAAVVLVVLSSVGGMLGCTQLVFGAPEEPIEAAATCGAEDLQAQLDQHQTNGDAQQAVTTLLEMGRSCQDIETFQQGLLYFQQALAISQEMGHLNLQAAVLQSVAEAYLAIGQTRSALDYFQQTLSVLRDAHDYVLERITLLRMAQLHESLGEGNRAIEYREQALIARTKKGKFYQALALENDASSYGLDGNYPSYITTYQQVLAIYQDLGDRSKQGRIIHRIGWAYFKQQEYQLALDHLQQALAIAREVNDWPSRLGMGSTLLSIGEVQVQLGEYGLAQEAYQQALVSTQMVKDEEGTEIALKELEQLKILQD